jgi:hypothetical protein
MGSLTEQVITQLNQEKEPVDPVAGVVVRELKRLSGRIQQYAGNPDKQGEYRLRLAKLADDAKEHGVISEHNFSKAVEKVVDSNQPADDFVDFQEEGSGF